MTKKYLLYIDILGFSQLVQTNPEKIDELYNTIDSLNAHAHTAFKTIVFSDTILVYNEYDPSTDADHGYFVMYACEFAQDLLYRMIGKDIFFRAILTYGSFDHYHLKNIECFYGPALIRAYLSEKKIQSIGLFIDTKSNKHNNVFPTSRYDNDLSFVFLNQPLESLQLDTEGELPAHPTLFDDTDADVFILPDLKFLKDIHFNMQKHSDPRVRVKHLSAWHFFRSRYQKIVDFIEASNFQPEPICPKHNWKSARKILSRDHGCTI